MIKTEELKIRLSERDKKLVRERAEALQMTMSEYIIYLVRRDYDESIKNEADGIQ